VAVAVALVNKFIIRRGYYYYYYYYYLYFGSPLKLVAWERYRDYSLPNLILLYVFYFFYPVLISWFKQQQHKKVKERGNKLRDGTLQRQNKINE